MAPGASTPHLEQALAYARRGWLVLPLWWPDARGDCACGLSDCESAGKHPIRRLTPHGLHDASNREKVVEDWWRQHPQANIGVRTGGGSGIVVLDVDGEPGRLALRGLIAHHDRLLARWAQSGPGGWHAYFAHPGTTVPNSAGRLGVGLDVRGDGGYVVAPPSLHHSRRRYRWLGEPAELPALPRWLLAIAAAPVHERSPLPLWLLPEDAHAYATAALRAEAREVTLAPPGQRNDRLNRAAFKLGQLVGAELIPELAVSEALLAAGLAAGPGERKIRATIRSGLRAGMLQPRQVLLGGRRRESEGEPC